jgi:hypothetical protein
MNLDLPWVPPTWPQIVGLGLLAVAWLLAGVVLIASEEDPDE